MPIKGPRHSSASAAATETLTYEIRDIVLAKVKGHPAWPARIIDPHTAPINLQDERKIAQKNSYLVKFFKTGDHAWMNSKEMSKLDPPEIKAFIDNPNKKGADLRAAYQIALSPEKWEAELEAIAREHEDNLKALELDELEPENDDDEPALPSKTKPKRKRLSEPKTPRDSAKKRKSEVLQPTNGSVNASATPEPTPVTGPKKRGRKKEEVAPPIIEGVDTVRDWRHKLQRIFLGKIEVTDKMMPDIDQTFKDIEGFEMKTEWLTVLKRIGALEDGKVPLDDKYHIRHRSRQLQEQWRVLLGIGEEAQRSQPAIEASNDPAEIPALPAEDEAEEKAKEEKEAPAQPTTSEEPMEVEQSTPSVPLDISATDEKKVPSSTLSKKLPENTDMTVADKPSTTNGHASEEVVATIDTGVVTADTPVIKAGELNHVTNGHSIHKLDEEMKEVGKSPAVVTKADATADEDDDEKMDLSGSTPPELPTPEATVQAEVTSKKAGNDDLTVKETLM
ncbi:hypothetical protein CROQUDRAFT_242495 [Cronartium quercuum f. sp. fusiforme G11]|uniref:PWWP domain-containing protein n=1 Tax=Cronartium quercuum f. sp. fusiforme G11 TaxID=708437 RepID=A0A9P6T7S1_9BASI|nr:hypothetical protein CROQUDRAFT_242495 [Cronartium quercuum f. sp. fusiforme G11]